MVIAASTRSGQAGVGLGVGVGLGDTVGDGVGDGVGLADGEPQAEPTPTTNIRMGTSLARCGPFDEFFMAWVST
ncbi:MAG TPA: hypothetical protein VF990_11315 [Candidatus Dormibacteraeota bacterium]